MPASSGAAGSEQANERTETKADAPVFLARCPLPAAGYLRSQKITPSSAKAGVKLVCR
jgi:hypothetical protein